jgi:hypothetical protein
MMEPFDFSWMAGRTFSGVRFDGSCRWFFSFEPNVGLWVDCPWRLVKNNRVVVSSEDHLQEYGLPAPLDALAIAQLLALQPIAQVQVREGIADICIELAGGIRLEAFPISTGYEAWGIMQASGVQVIALGGGQLCSC